MKPKIHKGPLVVVAIIIVLAFLGGQTAQAQSQTPARQEEAVQAQLKTKLLKKQHKSKTVINWWNNRGKPALGLKHEKCSELTGIKRQKVCKMARRSLAKHTTRLRTLQVHLERLSTSQWCLNLQGNRALGCKMASKIWPSQTEWEALSWLWQQESHWDNHAHNQTSAACGIPQAMNDCAFGYEPDAQIAWGLNYIQDRYSRPTSAKSHWLSHQWY